MYMTAEASEFLFNLDPQMLFDSILLIISMFVLCFFMSYLFFKPAKKLLTDRQEKIKNDLDDAAKDKEDSAKIKAEYEDKLKNIDKEAETILSEARSKAIANENKIVADAKEEAARIIARANQEAELEKQKVADEVKQEMVSVASLIAGKVVAANIDTTIQNTLVEQTLKEIGDSTWQS